jgi:flagellar secretion chaperone FliS
MTNPYQQYQRTQAESASPGELIVMMYNGAIRFLTAGRLKLDSQDMAGANSSLLRAQDVILELMVSVDVSVGEVARNLYDLYEFMHRHLIQANVKKDARMVDEVIVLLRELQSAWEQAIRADKSGAPPMSAVAAA